MKNDPEFEGHVGSMLQRQKLDWDLARKNYEGLNQVLEKNFDFGHFTIKVQFNPSRIVSSSAKVDAKSIRERKCFLCPAHLPVEQESIAFGEEYLILMNPFPIFRRHLTIPLKGHIPQAIIDRLSDMLELARALPNYTLFYNGPQCGASAPDHMHFQAGVKGIMPLDEEFGRIIEKEGTILIARKDFRLSALKGILRNGIAMESGSIAQLIIFFKRLYDILKEVPGKEPLMNVLSSFENGIWRLIVFPRDRHRPKQFFQEGENGLLLSPASVDFGGVLITPREEDFYKMSKDLIVDIFQQVSMNTEKFDQLVENLLEMESK